MKIFGAILAGGIGKRVERHSIPKQFITIGGIPIIVMSMQQFLANDKFETIYVAVHKDWVEYANELFRDSFSREENERIKVVLGGKERLDSFVNIMDAIIEEYGLHEDDVLICHDSVRPFVRKQMIDDCIQATVEDGIALTVVPVTDTIHCASSEKYIDGTLKRNVLFNGQTPSGFNIRLLKEACDSVTDEEKKLLLARPSLC